MIMITKILKNQTVSTILAAVVIFAGVLLYLPRAGVVRSLPLIAVFCALAWLICRSNRTVAVLTFVLSFTMLCVEGDSLMTSAVFSLAAVVFAVAGMFAAELVRRLRSENTSDGKRKQAFYLADIVLALFVMYTLVCGNIFSALSHNISNTRYILENYNNSVKKKYTYYNTVDCAYRTRIEFSDDGITVGHENECFVEKKHGTVIDGCRDYYEQKMLLQPVRVLKGILAYGADKYEICAADVSFENGEILAPDFDPALYTNRVRYIVGLYSESNNMADFVKMCRRCVEELENRRDFDFESITFCGGSVDSLEYMLTITPQTESSTVADSVKPFDKNVLAGFGITQNDVLSYWQNK